VISSSSEGGSRGSNWLVRQWQTINLEKIRGEQSTSQARSTIDLKKLNLPVACWRGWNFICGVFKGGRKENTKYKKSIGEAWQTIDLEKNINWIYLLQHFSRREEGAFLPGPHAFWCPWQCLWVSPRCLLHVFQHHHTFQNISRKAATIRLQKVGNQMLHHWRTVNNLPVMQAETMKQPEWVGH